MPLTADRKTAQLEERNIRTFDVAADEVIYAGALVAIDDTDAGLLYAGHADVNLIAVGMAMENKDATGLADGDLTCKVSTKASRWLNSAAADEITADDVGVTCYIVDDETVALTDGTGTRSPAGTVYQVDADGVWVIPPGV
jgi:hypothetical protein